jgi:hypothetical protein
MNLPRLIDLAADNPAHRHPKGRDQFVIDANAILESLLLQYGVDDALAALKSHDFKGDNYHSVAKQLHDAAQVRWAARREQQGAD